MQPETPIRLLVATTLYPNAVQPANGIFVETRLRKLLESGRATARVLAPVPWMPRAARGYGSYPPLFDVPPVERRHGIDIVHPRYLVVPKVGWLLTPRLLYAAMRRSLARMLAEGERFDAIDAHYFYPDGIAAVWLGRAFSLPVSITARGTDLNLIPDYAIPRRMIQRAAAQADGLITVASALKDRLVQLGVPAERVTVLRNGVDLQRFRPAPDRAAARRAWTMTRRTLLCVGHLIERKGQHLAIEALASLPDTDLLLAGSGPEETKLKALTGRFGVADRVRFLGPVPQTELADLYSAADALLLPSSREGWANVLLEAMASGTPVVASPVWGTPEVVAEPEAGLLMRDLSAAAIVEGVNRLFAALPDRASTRRYAERFGWEETTEGQLALFRRILAQRSVGERPAG